MQIIQNNQNSGEHKTPSQDAAQRIKYLAEVGNALMQTASDRTYLTSFYTAKDSLQEFSTLVNKLDLDPEAKTGINNLIQYLSRKIDKRLKNAEDPGVVTG